MTGWPSWFPRSGVPAVPTAVAPAPAPTDVLMPGDVVRNVSDEDGRGFPVELMPVAGGPALRNLEASDARTLLRRARRHGSVFIHSRLELAAARRLEALGLGAVELINGGPCRRFVIAEAAG